MKYFPGGYNKEIERREKEDEKSNNEVTSSTCVDIEGWVANATTTTDASKGLDVLDWRSTIDTGLNSLARLAMASELDSNVADERPNAESWNGRIHQETTANLSMPLTPAKFRGIPSDSEVNLSNGTCGLKCQPRSGLIHA